jgi:hypothetical protein
MPNQSSNPAPSTAAPKLRNDWRTLSLSLYQKLYGRMCAACHDRVDLSKDGVIYEISGDFMLLHSACVNK